MKIGIDARFFGTKNKGLGRYTQKWVEELEKTDDKNEYFIFLKKENFSGYNPKNKNFKKILADYKWYGLAEQIYFPLKIKSLKIDLMHFPHFNVPIFTPSKYVVTIHDLIPFYFPSRAATQLNPILYKIKYLGYKLVIRRALKKSRKIIAVSNFTKNDILKNFPKIKADKITVIYEGSDFYQNIKSENANDRVNDYILYIGNAYPHKNLQTLIDAFKMATQKFKNLNLLIVGINDYFFKKIKKENEKETKIIFIDNPPDQQLADIYKNALIYIAPSMYEGFGLPAIEAMSFKIPVVASDIEVFHEILKDAALFFNPKNPDALKKAIEKILEDNQLKESLRINGLAQSEKYKWSDMAKQMAEIYNQLC